MQQVARWLKDLQNAVAFTGAGISTDSGVPYFRPTLTEINRSLETLP